MQTDSNILQLGLAIAAMVTGLRSAWLWFSASRVEIPPLWVRDGRIQPLDPASEHIEWIISILETGKEAGKLNRRAAVWTALTIVLTTLTALLGSLSACVKLEF